MEQLRDVFQHVVNQGLLPLPHYESSTSQASGRMLTIKSPLQELSQTCKLFRDDLCLARAAEGGKGSFVTALCALQPEKRALSALRHVLCQTTAEAVLLMRIVAPRALCAAARAGHVSVVHELLTHRKTKAVFTLRRPVFHRDLDFDMPQDQSREPHGAYLRLFLNTTSPLILACTLPSTTLSIPISVMPIYGPLALVGVGDVSLTNGEKVYEIVQLLLHSPLFLHAKSATRANHDAAVIACIVRGHDAALRALVEFNPALVTDIALAVAARARNLPAARILMDISSRCAVPLLHPFEELPWRELNNVWTQLDALLTPQPVPLRHARLQNAAHEAIDIAKDATVQSGGCAMFAFICSDERVIAGLTPQDFEDWVPRIARVDGLAAVLATFIASPKCILNDFRHNIHYCVANAVTANMMHTTAVFLANPTVSYFLLEREQNWHCSLMNTLMAVCFNASTTRRQLDLAAKTLANQAKQKIDKVDEEEEEEDEEIEKEDAAFNMILKVPLLGDFYDRYLEEQHVENTAQTNKVNEAQLASAQRFASVDATFDAETLAIAQCREYNCVCCASRRIFPSKTLCRRERCSKKETMCKSKGSRTCQDPCTRSRQYTDTRRGPTNSGQCHVTYNGQDSRSDTRTSKTCH